MSGGPPFTDWGSPHSSGLIPPEWLQQVYAYLIQHPLPGMSGQTAGQGIAGTVNADGTVPDDGGVGFTVTHVATGTYTITFEAEFSGVPVVMLTPGHDRTGASYTSRTTTTIGLTVFDSRTTDLVDRPFSFLAQAPRT